MVGEGVDSDPPNVVVGAGVGFASFANAGFVHECKDGVFVSAAVVGHGCPPSCCTCCCKLTHATTTQVEELLFP